MRRLLNYILLLTITALFNIGCTQSFIVGDTLASDTHYEIGDIISIRGVKGIVFQTTPSVKIVSVTEGYTTWGESGVTTGVTDQNNGKLNMAAIQSISGWGTRYPAFKWCADIGDGWYLPALNELKEIYKQKDVLNRVLSANHMSELGLNDGWLWSSTEESGYLAYLVLISGGSDFSGYKNNSDAVRAVLAF